MALPLINKQIKTVRNTRQINKYTIKIDYRREITEGKQRMPRLFGGGVISMTLYG